MDTVPHTLLRGWMTSRAAWVIVRSGRRSRRSIRGRQAERWEHHQALQSVGGLQSKKNIKPFVIDYDNTNLLLSVVDTGFLIWLESQTRADVLDLVSLPKD